MKNNEMLVTVSFVSVLAVAIFCIAATNDIHADSKISIGPILSVQEMNSLTIACGDGQIVINYKTGKVTLPKDQKLDAVTLGFWKAVEKCFPKEFPLGGLIVTSGLETNRVESEIKPSFYISYGDGSFPIISKKKTITTTVEFVKRLKFEWEGKPRVVEDRELISQKVQTFVPKESWEKESDESDITPRNLGNGAFLTNEIVTNILWNITNLSATNYILIGKTNTTLNPNL